MTEQRRLLLVRHAKAERGSDARDHGRALTPRGRRDAASLGRWLLAEALVPDLVVCSSAVRAGQTWLAASSELADPPPARDEPALYDSSVARFLAVLARTSPAVRTLAVVGHEPTTSAVASALAGPGSDGVALAKIRAGLATTGVALLGVPGDWADVEGGSAVLLRHAVPRG